MKRQTEQTAAAVPTEAVEIGEITERRALVRLGFNALMKRDRQVFFPLFLYAR